MLNLSLEPSSSPDDEEIDLGVGKYIKPFSELITHLLSHSCRSATTVNLLSLGSFIFNLPKILC